MAGQKVFFISLLIFIFGPGNCSWAKSKMPDSQGTEKTRKGRSNDDVNPRNSPSDIDDLDGGGLDCDGCGGYDSGGSREGSTTYGPMVRSAAFQEKFLAARSWLLANWPTSRSNLHWVPWTVTPLVAMVAQKVIHRKLAAVIAWSSLFASFTAWAKDSGEVAIDPLSLLTSPLLSDQEALEWSQQEQYFPIISLLLHSLEQRYCQGRQASERIEMPPFCQQGK